MNNVKSILRFITTYDRTTTYDDTIEETQRMQSYTAYDEAGNLCCDKSYNADGECENMCKRNYDEQNQVVEELFFDGLDDKPYETRKNTYDAKGLLIESIVNYSEEKVVEKYIYNEDNKLIEKKVIYPDGYCYIENKYQWENGLLMDECEFEDEDTINIRKKYTYDEFGRLIRLEVHEITQDNLVSETYAYNEVGMTKQITYNFRGDVMTSRTYVYNENNLLSERIIETPSQFLKYSYAYNDKKLLIKECVLNKDDIILSMKEISYNDANDEEKVDLYSSNLVEHIDELILIETHTTTYEYY